MDEREHIPVLFQEVIEFLKPSPADIMVDATLGLGGHSAVIAEKIGEKGHLYAFDQDERNLEKAEINLKKYKDRITFLHSNFAEMREALDALQVEAIDGALFDIGISSLHLDEAERGFSFRNDGPLDMRMDQRQELTAREVVNRFGEEKIANLIYEYGEERHSRRIAKAIVMARRQDPIDTTAQLAEIVASAKRAGRKGIHPATQTFQALRIYVNDELGVLREGLQAAFSLLKPGGRLVVISFHSLEDRIVKRFFKEKASKCICGPDAMRCECEKQVEAEILTKKPIGPTDQERQENPRSRSAKLRALKKIAQK